MSERQLRYARHALASHRAALLTLLTALEGDAARWRPRPGAWNALEIANHLADEERDVSLQWLAELEAPDLSRAHRHPALGPVPAGDLLVSGVAHVLFHIRQLVRLHYRHLAVVFPDGDPSYAGAWGEP